jgi:hypothetical protein
MMGNSQVLKIHDPILLEIFEDCWNEFKSKETGKEIKFSKIFSYEEKYKKLLELFLKEIGKLSNIDITAPLEQFCMHPIAVWYFNEAVSSFASYVLTETVKNDFYFFAEIRNLSWGDSFQFEVNEKEIFAVCKNFRGSDTSEIHKYFKGFIQLIPEYSPKILNIQPYSMWSIFHEGHSLMNLINDVVDKFKTETMIKVYNTLAVCLDQLKKEIPNALNADYSPENIVSMCDFISKWNNDVTSIVIGSETAMQRVVSEYSKKSSGNLIDAMFVPNYEMYAIPDLVVKQLNDLSKSIFDSNSVWIVSPSVGGLIKICLGELEYGNYGSNLLKDQIILRDKVSCGVCLSLTIGKLELQ